ncbi:MAG: S8 family peptidase [Planctomycetaceae bacterium]|nr:S8 family peptidase [Planctomycetaceae bacterium]
MPQFRHFFPTATVTREQYTYAKEGGGGDFKTPPRDDRPAHGGQLIQNLGDAAQRAELASAEKPAEQRPKGFVLDFASDPAFKLKLESLEMRASGIELCSSRVDSAGVMHGTVFIPHGKAGLFVGKFEAYIKQEPKKHDHRRLVESITSIRLATLEAFWTDAGGFPTQIDERLDWEVWLRERTNPHDVSEQFRRSAQAAGVDVSARELRFPERRVLLCRATTTQLLQIENLFDMLAELRLAKRLATEFVAMAPREQAALISSALSRIQPPTVDAPAVCHLDTGVNRAHPLLAIALAEPDVLACDPTWPPADTHVQQHGTAMAGIGLYGCLTELLSTAGPVQLRHRLESVKIIRDVAANDPDLYGDVTDQAISRIEIASPQRQRAFCLTVTADSRDDGMPSSWSAALDRTCAGTDDDERRLVFVSAGNTPPDGRHDWPSVNHLHGVEDPAHASNVVSVGGYTERVVIHDPAYDGWRPVAESGRLCPASRTSTIWRDKSWPLKPDIVMEAGNQAIDPATGRADYLDDLMLLTTRMSPTGALLTTTADTSAATALAARYAAIILAHYPDLWPESVRGLMIQSARWTDAMRREFPDHERHARLRCYGYGVPDLARALWSLTNSATMLVENELQPFDKVDGKVKTKDMHLHRLPWPTAVLESLAATPIRLRVTLSYFIEPSPGRRGWTRKHRYQSHGLRFAVKHPLETELDFRKRLSRSAWEEEERAPSLNDDRNWELGQQLRCKGSIHSDTWTGTAAELAQCGMVAVFPVTGWWRERPHLERWNRKARYSLVVTLETPRVDVDLYTPIATLLGVPVQQVIEV